MEGLEHEKVLFTDDVKRYQCSYDDEKNAIFLYCSMSRTDKLINLHSRPKYKQVTYKYDALASNIFLPNMILQEMNNCNR